MKLTPHVFLFAALCSVAAPAFASSLTLPKGAPVSVYVSGTQDPSSIAAKNCLLATQTKDLALLNDLTITRNEAYVDEAVLNSALSLAIVSTTVSSGKGNECDYRGVPSDDPDFSCDSTKQGHWMKSRVKLADKYGNTWYFGHQTGFAGPTADLPSKEMFTTQTLAKMQTECTR